MFKNIKIGRKLVIGFGSVLLLMVLAMAIAYMNVSRLDNEIMQMVNDKYVKAKDLNEVASDINVVAQAIGNMIIYGDAETQRKEEQRVTEASARIGKNFTELEKLVQSENGRRHFKAVTDARKSYQDEQAAMLNLLR